MAHGSIFGLKYKMALPHTIKIRSGYIIAFFLLLVSYFLIFYAIRQLNQATGSVTSSYEVMNNLESIKTEIISAETGVRGYAITRDSSFLIPYFASSRTVMPLLDSIKLRTMDNADHRTKLKYLESLLERRLVVLAQSVESYDSTGYVSRQMQIRWEGSRLLMDSIRLLINQMEASESKLVRERQNNLKGIFSGTQIITIASFIIALITIFFSVTVYNRENKAKEMADSQAAEFREELEKKVAELDEMNRELQELRSIEKFASTGRIARTMAHEVRNPLTNISLATEQLKEITANHEDSETLLSMITRNAHRINQLVSDLLSATRFVQLNFEKLDFTSLLEETLELAVDRIELKQIKVEKHYSREPCIIEADREKMKVALLNIIVNALEAMEAGKGMLQIKTWKKGEKCFLEIKDNGMGMNEDTLSKIFDPYFTNKNKGNGLGLTNTQNTILNHKGSIRVSSKLGVGTIFTITLNIHQ